MEMQSHTEGVPTATIAAEELPKKTAKAISVSLMLMHVGLILIAVVAMVMSMPSTSLAS